MKRTVIELNGIKYEEVGGELKYRLVEEYFYDTGIMVRSPIIHGKVVLCTTGRLHFLVGYRWNGATGVPDTDSVIRASLVHDGLFDMFQAGLLDTRHVITSNNIFRRICKEDGMCGLVYWTYRTGLLLFSRFLIPRRFRKRKHLEEQEK